MLNQKRISFDLVLTSIILTFSFLLFHPFVDHVYADNIDDLIKALNNPNEAFKASIALAEMKDPASVEPLIKALKSEYEVVRSRAANVLEIIGDKRACEALFEVYVHDNDPSTQDSARRAFKKIGCSFKEYGQEYRFEKSLCGWGQRLVDFAVKNIENNSYDERLEESPEFHKLMSDLNSEIERLQSEDLDEGNKLFSVFFMVNDWADYVAKIRRAKQDSYGEKIDPLNATASENIDDKATRLQLICPEINIPDYSE